MPYKLSTIVVLILLLVPGIASSAKENTAAQVVSSFQAQLLMAMKNAGKLGFQGRFDKLKPAVEQSHDLTGIATIAVGSAWNKLNDAQKKRLVDTFTKLSVATYANRFDSYSGEQFQTVASNTTDRGYKMVRTLLKKPHGDDVHLDYILLMQDNRWQIINIVADGVSDLSLKRSEYTRILRQSGFDGLIARMQEKIKHYQG